MKYRRFFAAALAAVMLITSVGCNEGEMSSVADSSSVIEESNIPADTSSVSVGTTASSDEPVEEQSTTAVTADSTTAGSTAAPVESTTASDAQPPVTSSQAAEATTTAAATIATTTAATTTTASTAATKPAEKKLTVSYNISNTWQEGGKECTQIEFVVKNGKPTPAESWNLTLDFGQEVEVMQSWNVNVTSAGSSLKASNVEYNGAIAAGGETSFGCIVKTSSEVKKITSSTSSVQGSNTSVQQPADTTTAATTPSKPPVEENIEITNRAGLVSVHGQLSVKGTNLVDKNGEPVQLRGVSTHGIQWFPAFANKQLFKHLRDEWNTNVIRLAMYSGAGEGYTDSTKAGIEKTVQDAVDAAIELDMYVIIDWHVLQDQSPQVRKADALRFFEYMSEKYADYPNVIYEICNEPNGYATWSGDVKPYAEEVIPVIRKNDPDSVIIVGTPTWSQDIDKALADPLDYDNIMYALHYYAATHTDWLRDRVKSCYNSGLPIMVTEFGNCDASGNGNNDFGQAEKWLNLLDSLNISYMNWALCDKAETASLLRPGASTTGGWSNDQLTDNGKFMKNWFRNHR